jgi:hypothetical protein
LGILQKIDQTIEDLILLKSKGADGLTITASGQQLPLHCAGTELIKLIDICLALINEKNSLSADRRNRKWIPLFNVRDSMVGT